MTPQSPTDTYTFFATCARNTEGLLLEELQALGAARATETRAGASFEGPLSDAYKVCLWSRVASRVLLRMKTFPMRTADDLYEAVRRVPWEDHVDLGGTIAVEVTSAMTQGPLANLNTHFAEQRVKDAVVDRFRERPGGRPGVDLTHPDLRTQHSSGTRRLSSPKPCSVWTFGRRAAPTGLSAGRSRSSPQREPRRSHPDAGQLAADRGRRR